MSIVTLAAAKKQLNIKPDYTDDDLEIQLYIDALVVPIERELGRVVEQRTFVDEFEFATGTTSFLLRSVPAVSLTSITAVDGSTTWPVDAGTMHLNGDSGQVTVLSGSPLSGLVQVAYLAGPATVAANVRLAGLIILQHLWETQRGTMGVQLGDTETFMPGRGFAIPRRAIELLGTQLPGVA